MRPFKAGRTIAGLMAAAAALAAALPAASAAAEFEATDKLTANSYALFKTSMNISGAAFSVGASSFAVSYGKVGIGTGAPQYLLHVSSAAGVSGNLVLISTGASNVIRMTGAGEIYANRFYGDVSGAWGAGPDNLGNHTGTTTLNMGAYGINTTSAVSAGYYQINGSTVMGLLYNGGLAAGPYAGSVNSGGGNIFLGAYSGYNNTSGVRNTFAGAWAGYMNDSASDNVFIGRSAGGHTTSLAPGYYNVCMGNVVCGGSGGGAYIGSRNVVIGNNSNRQAAGGNDNAVIGQSSLLSAGSAVSSLGTNVMNAGGASSSTIMGAYAGRQAAGADNIFIGYTAGYDVTTGSGNIVIDANNSRPINPDESMKLNIGGLIYGDLNPTSGMKAGIGTSTPAAKLDIMDASGGSQYVLKVGTAAGSYQLVVTSEGFVGVGMSAPSNPLDVYRINSDPRNTAAEYGMLVYQNIQSALTGAKSAVRAESRAVHTSGNIGSLYGTIAVQFNNSTSPVTTGMGTNARVDNNNAAGSITNAYAVFLDTAIGTITNNYGLYQQDTIAQNVFLGKVGLGAKTPAAMLDILGNTADAYSLKVGTDAGTYALVITTAGRMGINTASPAARLDIAGPSGTNFLTVQNETDWNGIYAGAGAPHGVIAAPPGSMYMDQSAGTIYAKLYGDSTVSTGWSEMNNSSYTCMGSMRRAAAYTLVTKDVWYTIPFDTIDYAYGMTGTTGASAKLTANKAGYYFIDGFVGLDSMSLAGATNSNLVIEVRVNGTAIKSATSHVPYGVYWGTGQLQTFYYLSAGDYVTLHALFGGVADANNPTFAAYHLQPRLTVVEMNGGAGLGTYVADITGGGTPGRAAKFSSAKNITDSVVTESGSKIGISSAAPAHELSVEGSLNFSGETIYLNGKRWLGVGPSGNSFTLGDSAGNANGGGMNVFIGPSAGNWNTGSENTFVGFSAGFSNTTGINNTFMGLNAGYSNNTGSNNVAIGRGAGKLNGWANVAAGDNAAGVSSGSGPSSSTAVGYFAGYYATGAGNIFMGFQAGYDVATGSGNIIIGYNERGAPADMMKLNIGGLLYGDMNASAMRVGISTGAPVATLEIYDTGAMIIPSGTVAQRPSPVYQGMMRYNDDFDTVETATAASSGSWNSLAYQGGGCSGGTETTTSIGGKTYKVHTFTASGNLTCSGNLQMEYLVVGGGGGGGGQNCGSGGGAGGFRIGSFLLIAENTVIPVQVGAGGSGGNSTNSYAGRVGLHSALGPIVAAGGGAGQSRGGGCREGGSGGGGAPPALTGTQGGCAGNDPSETPSQGSPGGSGSHVSGVSICGGGGGGAYSTGQNCSVNQGGNGGYGFFYDIDGTARRYCDGGGGGGHTGSTASIGGPAGSANKVGGNGGGATGNGGNATANRGGGGGGAGNAAAATGGNGGSGIVIVRYPQY